MSASNTLNRPGAVSPQTVSMILLLISTVVFAVLTASFAVRGPVVVTQTQYQTEMQSLSFTNTVTSISTSTQPTTQTVVSYYTQSQYDGYNPYYSNPSTNWFNPAPGYCGYPMNPYVCNEGPAVTVIGLLTNSSECMFLYGTIQGSGNYNTLTNYVVYNLPNGTYNGNYEVYGFIYPNWPQGQPFPPYPFQRSVCIGVPLYAIPPYIQGN